MAIRRFGKLAAEVLTNAQFDTISTVPNTYHVDTVVHGGRFRPDTLVFL